MKKIFNILAVVLVLTFVTVQADALDFDRWFPVTNGAVHTLLERSGTLYLGGEFTGIGPATGSFARVDATTGNLVPGSPLFGSGMTDVVVSDGVGGWYVGGGFDTVEGVAATKHLLHILLSGQLDPAWQFTTGGGSPSAILVDGANIYVGGNFSDIDGTPRGKGAVISTAGVLQPWDPHLPGGVPNVYAIAKSGSTVFLGGYFSVVSGTARNNVAAVDATTGTLLPWYPTGGANGDVYDLVVDGTNLYMGGLYYCGRTGQVVPRQVGCDQCNGRSWL